MIVLNGKQKAETFRLPGGRCIDQELDGVAGAHLYFSRTVAAETAVALEDEALVRPFAVGAGGEFAGGNRGPTGGILL